MTSEIGRELALTIDKYKIKHGCDKGFDTAKCRLKFSTVELKLVKMGNEYRREMKGTEKGKVLMSSKILNWQKVCMDF